MASLAFISNKHFKMFTFVTTRDNTFAKETGWHLYKCFIWIQVFATVYQVGLYQILDIKNWELSKFGSKNVEIECQ